MRLIFWTIFALLPLTLSSPLPLPVKRQTALNRFVTILLSTVPAINGPIEKVSGILTAFQHILATLTWQQTTYNDLSCKDYALIFAKGTTEPGNVGILVGPPFIEALKDKVGARALAVQGVNGYDADVEGYLAGGDAGGSLNLKNQIEATKVRCPNTKLIIAGYSQGGMLIHNAAASISDSTAAWISKVLIFGDPFSLKPLPKVAPKKVKVYCHLGDDICRNGALILPPHLTYAIDARDAATFATS